MKYLKIEGTHKTPLVTLDKQEQVFLIEGHSRPDDAGEFFEPVKVWIQNYASDPNEFTHFEFKMDFFDVDSLKVFARILSVLNKLKQEGKRVKVSWYHMDDDHDMLEMAMDFADVVDELHIETVSLN